MKLLRFTDACVIDEDIYLHLLFLYLLDEIINILLGGDIKVLAFDSIVFVDLLPTLVCYFWFLSTCCKDLGVWIKTNEGFCQLVANAFVGACDEDLQRKIHMNIKY